MNQPVRYEISAHPVDESDRDMKIRLSSVHIGTYIGMCTRLHINAKMVISINNSQVIVSHLYNQEDMGPIP